MQETNATATAEPVESSPVESSAQVEKVAEPAVEKPSSSKLLDFARKEAEFAKKEVARKQEIEKLSSDYKKLEEEITYFRKAKDTYKDNPEEFLERLGISYENLTDAIIDYYDKQKQAPATLDPESIRKEIEEQFTRKEQEKLAREHRQVIENFGKEIQQFVETNKEKLPHLTQLYKPFGESESPEEFIFQIIQEYYDETGEMLSLENATQNAEEYFREEWNKLNGVFSKEPKVVVETKTENKEVAPPAPTESPAIEAPMTRERFKMKDMNTPNTITNNLAKPQRRVAYDPTKTERRDAISRAVEAMEAASRRAK